VSSVIGPRGRTTLQDVGLATMRLTGLSAGLFVTKSGISATEGLVTCPIHRLTGLLCPGCGGTRSSMMLLEGDVGGAISMYPPIVCVAVVSGAIAFGWVSGFGVPAGLRAVGQKLIPFAAIGLAAFGILRNIEMFGYLRPG